MWQSAPRHLKELVVVDSHGVRASHRNASCVEEHLIICRKAEDRHFAVLLWLCSEHDPSAQSNRIMIMKIGQWLHQMDFGTAPSARNELLALDGIAYWKKLNLSMATLQELTMTTKHLLTFEAQK